MNDLPLFRTTPKSAAQHRTASCLNSNECALFRFLTVHFPIRVSLSPVNLDVTRTEKTDFLTSFAFMCFSVCVLSFFGEKRRERDRKGSGVVSETDRPGHAASTR